MPSKSIIELHKNLLLRVANSIPAAVRAHSTPLFTELCDALGVPTDFASNCIVKAPLRGGIEWGVSQRLGVVIICHRPSSPRFDDEFVPGRFYCVEWMQNLSQLCPSISMPTFEHYLTHAPKRDPLVLRSFVPGLKLGFTLKDRLTPDDFASLTRPVTVDDLKYLAINLRRYSGFGPFSSGEHSVEIEKCLAERGVAPVVA